jgi:hypothetical protein
MAVRVAGSQVRSSAVAVIAVVGAGLLVGAVVLLGSLGGPDAGSALLLGPLLVVISLPVLSRRARLDGDRRLFWLLLAALVLKLIGALVRHYIVFGVYGGVADAETYHDQGAIMASHFRVGDFHTGLDSLTSTNFIKLLTGVVYTIVGTSRLGGFLIFSWLGFWGLYLFYRAFCEAVPEGRRTSYRSLVFFLPSLVFWPSSIGKEAWMMLALGIAAVGAARALSGRTWRGLLVAATGLWLAAIVRPHVAGLLGLALVAGFMLRRSGGVRRHGAPVAKAVGLAAVAMLALVLLIRTDRFLKESAIRTEGGVTQVLRQTSERTGRGGSEFTPSALESPARTPIAVITVLYRPLLIEAENLPSLAAALETTFLLALSIARFKWFLASLRSVRRQPYVGMAILYTALFILAFSGFANFGLLARERVQLLPLFLVLLCIPPRPRSAVPDP